MYLSFVLLCYVYIMAHKFNTVVKCSKNLCLLYKNFETDVTSALKQAGWAISRLEPSGSENQKFMLASDGTNQTKINCVIAGVIRLGRRCVLFTKIFQ